jgi:hypothetical protein
MRGRAFGFVVILCTTWVTVRVGFTLIADGDRHAAPHQTVSAGDMVQPEGYFKPNRLPSFIAERTGSASNQTKSKGSVTVPTSIEIIDFRTNSPIYTMIDKQDDWVADNKNPNPISSNIISAALFESPKKLSSTRLIKIYAYSFWRQGDATHGVLGNGQYGGSQSALLMTIPMPRHTRDSRVAPLSLIGRASVSHDATRAREWTAGLLWHPSTAFPAQLSLERRFRPNRPDAIAAFVSGGYDGTPLPLGFVIDGYGQAGFVTGESGGAFADAQLYALKSIARNQGIALTAGAGAWAGGQSNIMRVDMGPSVRANLKAGAASLRLDASWRFRVAGKATPGDGPTVTLSTSF